MHENIKVFVSRLIEPKKQIAAEKKYYSNHDLKVMIVPLLIEQMLQMLVGMADTMMVSYAGEATVSGVSLDNTIYTVFIYLVTALASGGSIVASQYVGAKKKDDAVVTASQLFLISGLFSVICMVLMLIFEKQILVFLFGSIEKQVMEACRIYMFIVCLSMPANGIYNAGAAIYRTIGLTGITMRVSLVTNLINIVGNAIGIFYLHAGAAGVAWPTTISWYFAAIIMVWLCLDKDRAIYIDVRHIFIPVIEKIQRILKVAVPNAIENGLFQMTKLILTALVATYGTIQIAAYGIAQTLFTLSAGMLVSCGPALMAVVSYCMGADDADAADYYFDKLMRLVRLMALIWNVVLTALLPFIIQFYDVSDETRRLILIICLIHNAFSGTVQAFFNPLPAGLRAAGDVKFTMVTSMISSVLVRIFNSWLLGSYFHLGVIGITLAMCGDWVMRGSMAWHRYRSGKWKTIKVI